MNYGGGVGKFVRAITKARLLATDLEGPSDTRQCKLVFEQFFDLGGFIPAAVINKQLPKSLAVMKALTDSFQRDDEIDQAALASLADIIRSDDTQTYTRDELKAIEEGKKFFDKAIKESANVEPLESPDPMVEMKAVHVDRESLVTGLTTTIVDATVEECAAREFTGTYSRSYQRLAQGRGITEWHNVFINDHSLYWFTTRDLKVPIPGFLEREFRTKVIWHKDDKGRVLLDFADTTERDHSYQVKSKRSVRGSVRTVWSFEQLPPVGGISQTKVFFTTRVNLGGAIPSSVMNTLASKLLSAASDLRKKFDRSREIDAYNRLQIVDKMKNLAVDSYNNFDENFKDLQGMQEVHTAFPLSSTWVKVEGRGKGWGKMTVSVPIDLENVAAFFWDFESRVHEATTGDVERVVELREGDWKMTASRVQKVKSEHHVTHRLRRFLNVVRLRKVDTDTIVITMDPLSQQQGRPWKGSSREVEGTEEGAMRLTRLGEEKTKVEFVTKLKLGGSVSDVTTRIALERHLDEAADAERYFIDAIPLQDMTKEEGEDLGMDLVWEGGRIGGGNLRKDKMRHVEERCKESKALKAVVKRFPWFVTLLQRALSGEYTFNTSQNTKLECVTEKEARIIGRNLMPCLKSRKMATAGVEQVRRSEQRSEWQGGLLFSYSVSHHFAPAFTLLLLVEVPKPGGR